MPKPLSPDLRQRVLDVYDRRELRQEEVAERFGIGVSTLRKLLALREQTGSIAPRAHGGGPEPKLSDEQMALLREQIAATPDATQQELADRLEASGAPTLHRSTIGRAVARLKLTRKKSQSRPPSEKPSE